MREFCPSRCDGNWELPSFDAAKYAEKRHQYALIIPVINEGDRIRKQLEKICDDEFAIDVIIADGGSNDGSLDPNFIRKVNVTAVLTNTGPGKLSAQLRMAYAWCLCEGYKGVVTIDGNGKDGLEAVADMVAKLEEGYDYVQGSRYLPGGLAENTPLERTIANRGIHAPLLSLAGRHWFTDTTNGFRAYSARYLLDPRVQPFREVFQRYSLLFYLTVRAGQIGLKVAHIPVQRRYPANVEVPTKISGMVSKLKLLGDTVSAATGGFTPSGSAPAHPNWAWPFLLTIMVTLPFFLGALIYPNFSPDSWAYYELGQTVFTDFYRFQHFRSYWNFSPYSAAFPPLYPAAIAFLDEFTHAGARSGLLLAFFSFIVFALLSEQIGRRAFGAAWLGLAMAFALLLGQGLLGEMTGGRTIPLQLILFSLVLLGLLGAKRLDSIGAVSIGTASGLAILNRFDAILLPVFTAFALWRLTGRPTLVLWALGGAAVSVSPWVIYSLTTFGVFFATDNSAVVKALDPKAYVTDWWPMAQPMLSDDPAVWFTRIFGNLANFIQSLCSVITSRMSGVLASALTLLAGLQYLSRYDQRNYAREDSKNEGLKVVSLFSAIMFALLVPQILTGYFDVRYFTALFWSGFFTIFGRFIIRSQTLHQRTVFSRLVCYFITSAVLVYSSVLLTKSATTGQLDMGLWSHFNAPSDVSTLKRCLRSDPTGRVLVLGDNNFAARAGAVGGLRTMMEPGNMRDGRLGAGGNRSFVAFWDVGYVLVMNRVQKDFAKEGFDLAPVPGCTMMLLRVIR